MRRHIQINIFLFVFITIFIYCGKEKEKEVAEGVLYPLEESIVHVDVPQVSWEESIAILPFTDNRGVVQDDAFSGLFRAELVSRLSRSDELKVMMLPAEDWLDREDVQVDYILKNEWDREQLILQLVNAQNNSILWMEHYDADTQFVLTAAENARARIVTSLMGDDKQIYPFEESAVAQDISEMAIEARSHLVRGTRAEIDLAIEQFKAILKIDTSYTLGYLGLAESYLKITNDLSDPNLVWLRMAQDAVLKAIQLDPNLDGGHLYLGQVYLARGDFLHAEEAFRRTIEINPNAEEAWIGLGQIYSHFGLYQPCLEVYERALSLNPANRLVLLSRALIRIGFVQYQEAEEDIRMLLQIYPEDLFYHSFLGLVFYYQNDLNDALTALNKGLQSDRYRSFSHAVLGMVYAKQGRLDDALAEVELEVKPNVGSDESLATAVAAVYALIGQNGQAIQWLEKAVDWGYREYPWLVNDPNFRDLRQDERFVTLLDRIKTEWETNMQSYLSGEFLL